MSTMRPGNVQVQATAPTQHSSAADLALSRGLVDALARAIGAEIIETHISWVLLARDVAYKVKKPVRTPFLNYQTLEHRRAFCEEEVRLNSRWAPGIYLDVQPITGTRASPILGGAPPVLEYAVRMKRFDESALFARRVETGSLRSEDVDALADWLAALHRSAPVARPQDGFGSSALRRKLALDALSGVLAADPPPNDIRQLSNWLANEATRCELIWRQRLEGGHVRECHGDLHLDNLLWADAGVAAFDGVEFDPRLRWIDVADDLAFPVMDFGKHGRADFGWRLLCGWLDRTGDHEALSVLRLSLVYRALVRCAVALLTGTKGKSAHQYLRCAIEWTRPRRRELTIMHGLPGSGKTTVSQTLLESEGAIRIRSDVERKRLWGLGMLESSRAAGLDIYTADATARTHARLFEITGLALDAGFSVIIDAAFLKFEERQRAQALAASHDANFRIAACEAALPVLESRLRLRHADASEADVAVLHRTWSEPLHQSELGFVQRFNAGMPDMAASLSKSQA